MFVIANLLIWLRLDHQYCTCEETGTSNEEEKDMTQTELTQRTQIIRLTGLAKLVASICLVPLTHVVDIAVDPHVMEK